MSAQPVRKYSAEPDSLEKHGLSWQPIHEALLRGLVSYREHTKNDIPSACGTETLSKVVSSLTEATRDGRLSEYVRVESNNQIVFLRGNNPSERFIVESGDRATGTDASPRTLSVKGPMTTAKIKINRMILGEDPERFLFAEQQPVFDQSAIPDEDRIPTWMLLFHIFPSGLIRAEFSLADDFREVSGNKCDITDFRYRIVLPVIPPEGELGRHLEPVNPSAYDGGFEIKRRTGSN